MIDYDKVRDTGHGTQAEADRGRSQRLSPRNPDLTSVREIADALRALC